MGRDPAAGRAATHSSSSQAIHEEGHSHSPGCSSAAAEACERPASRRPGMAPAAAGCAAPASGEAAAPPAAAASRRPALLLLLCGVAAAAACPHCAWWCVAHTVRLTGRHWANQSTWWLRFTWTLGAELRLLVSPMMVPTWWLLLR